MLPLPRVPNGNPCPGAGIADEPLLDTSVILASLDSDEPRHEACDRVVSAGGNKAYVHTLADCESRGVRGSAIYDWLHLAAARKAGAEVLLTLELRDFRSLARAGDPRIEMP